MPNLTIDNLQLFLIFAVPGFVAMKVYALLIPSEKRSAGNYLVEAVSYSMINLAFMSWAIILLRRDGFIDNHPYIYLVSTFIILFASPTILAIIVYRVGISKFSGRWILHPIPTAWDYFFGLRKQCWILFHLKNGKMVGGYWGDDSFISGYPQDHEIYIEQVWRVDEFGRFIEMVKDTEGMFIQYKDCDRMEFFTVEE